MQILFVILALALSCQGRGIDADENVNHPIETFHAKEAKEKREVQENVFLTDANARSDSPDPIYYLYRQSNQNNAEKVLADEDSILDATFSNGIITVFLIHGHDGNAFNDFNIYVKTGIFKSEDVNLIVVDWSFHASLSYTAAAGAVSIVAERISNFINELIKAGVTTVGQIHLVGFNLGAHVGGIVGRSIPGIPRITGLDPSRRQFESSSLSLRVTDALYVEVIHTDGGLLGSGLGTAIGRVDFFANGGSNQPGCLTNACSHRRAYELFAASMTNENLVGYKCSSQLLLSLNLCKGQSLSLGTNSFVKGGTGMYRINTKKFYPF